MAPQKAVETTISGAKFQWQVTAIDQKIITELSRECNILPATAQALYRRGFTTKEQILSFLCVRIDMIADGMLLKGADKAVSRINTALEGNEKILIFGDYDVDGITSTAIMLTALLPLLGERQSNLNYFLPHRVKDGYGLSEKIVEKAAQAGYSLIVTVDNGISAHKAVEKAAMLGVDVIITDHHRPHDDLPPAYAIVNPHQPGCDYPYKEFAGAGVIFKVMDLIYRGRDLPLPEKAYELLLLGTVADVVPLVNENRYWVQRGLALVNKKESTAMRVLKKNGRIEQKKEIDSLDIGFMLAPQLNALGRLDDPRDGVKFLISNDYEAVARIGVSLKTINEKRKQIDQAIFEEVSHLIAHGSIDLSRENIIMAASHNWPPGVIGLVAGKLMHAYGRPAILLHLSKDGTAKGSCRSIASFNIFDALSESSDLLTSFGGHACAAGLSLRADDISVLKERLEKKIAAELSPEDLIQKITIDAAVTLDQVGTQLVDDLRRMAPFGNGNEQPCFWVYNAVVAAPPRLLKDKHVKCTVESDGVINSVMFFNRPELYDFLCESVGKKINIAAYVVQNEWQNRVSVELHGLDVGEAQ